MDLEGIKLFQEGPILITHWGFSGPAALKLSAFGARYLSEKDYEVGLCIDWLPKFTVDELMAFLKLENPTKKLGNIRSIPLPKRLWKLLCGEENQLLIGMGKPAIRKLCEKLKSDRYQVKGKQQTKKSLLLVEV